MAPQGAAGADRAGHVVDPTHPSSAHVRPPPRHGLPISQTSFVGRALELAEVTQLLSTPNCRLLTIIGPGGIGKTRLAVAAAEAVRERFADGVAFVPLEPLSAGEPIAPVLAGAIGCVLSGRGDAREQVSRFLRPASMLLVVDNVEHLTGEAAWLGELLAEAPGLCLIVTSRVALNLREEWRYPLAGLAVPAGDDDPRRADAVRLFVERAQQVRPDFSFESERDGVVELCRSVEGLPLALELAAAWVRTLPCADIAAEIDRTIAFLATDLRNVPARHRSMKAAFDHSWSLLAGDETRVFQRLAVFQGGFSREAAERVAGATLPLLSSLVDKSLVRREADGRFYLHGLLREYADEHLRAEPAEATRADAAHREFYLRFVAERVSALVGGAQREAIVDITREYDNIRAAWRGAVAVADIEALGRASHPLTLFFDFRARYREGMALLEEGMRAVRAAPPSLAVDRITAAMLVDVVRMNHRLARIPAMRAALDEAEQRYATLGGPPPPGQMTDPRLWRSLVLMIDGQYADAARLAAAAIDANTHDVRPGNLPFGWWLRAAAALWQEDLSSADTCSRTCTEAAGAVDDRWMLAYCHNQQGHVAVSRGDYPAARRHYQASYALREELDDPEGTGTALSHLGKVAFLEGDPVEAERLFRRAIDIARDIGDQITPALALNGLATIACAAGDYVAAGRYLAQGMRPMADAGYLRLLLTLLASAGDWLVRTGDIGLATRVLECVLAHPACDPDTRAQARRLLASIEGYRAGAPEPQPDTDPVDLVDELIPLLTAPVAADAPAPRPISASALVEPLTARELSVLRLIAAGQSNRDIADELFLSVNTVRSYSQQLYGKLGVGSRTQAIARARELGILD